MIEALKDDVLAQLTSEFNVAQFVSFSPGANPDLRHTRVKGENPDEAFPTLEAALSALLRSSHGSVNVRSFRLDKPKGNPFRYGITNAQDAASAVRSLAADGYHTIVNETIDVNDGGVSGVALGTLIEFAPEDTPRAVERPGTAALERTLASRLLEAVYGFRPSLPRATDQRVEFSIHPIGVGYRETHTVLWEISGDESVSIQPALVWPNRFSRFIGDKTYGLLIAHLLGLLVPHTIVIGRNVAPFTFGTQTDTNETWLRTCPTEQQPGRYTSTKGWTDPFRLLDIEDPDGKAIVAVLAQDAVAARHSGATLPSGRNNSSYVEGTSGQGDRFMLGAQEPSRLPDHVMNDVQQLANQAAGKLGPVRLEWVHDGRRAWIVQMHLAKHTFIPGVISLGEPRNGWLDFDAHDGLDLLADLIARAAVDDKGIRVLGSVGYTSHVGDLLRKASVPGRIILTT